MILSALLLAASAPCAKVDAQIPRDLSGWSRTGKGLDTGHSVTLTGAKGTAETRVTIRKAGTFAIALDQQAWVDVYPAQGKPLRMAYQSGGPSCTSIRKIVRYRLEPGSYRVVATKLASDRVKLMLVYRPPGPSDRPERTAAATRQGRR